MVYRAGLCSLAVILAIATANNNAVAQPSQAQASSSPARHVYHHHFHTRHRAAAPLARATAPRQSAPPADDRGFVPAPVVPQAPPVTDANANLLPPQASVPGGTQVAPGTMQLHYPFAGNGYVTGSSPQAMDDATTAKIPGVIVKLPIQPPAPQPLPPP